MRNCAFCHRPLSDHCYVLIKGHLAGKEFKVENGSEFVCEQCVNQASSDPIPVLDGIKVGDVVLLKEHT